ncbi:hypothetical protein QR680_011214 [Steinernema hermaphroditum]|uniref:G domain-containing protein n=1 Tax=Steinernema hermaphroditum TaxID=289476 RepID=A0AA39IU94_9BILA|nr:hypothetical protein QR680_011214 [Steinernema hermaphroditum]
MVHPSIFVKVVKTNIQVDIPLVSHDNIEKILENLYLERFRKPAKELGVLLRKYSLKFNEYVNVDEDIKCVYPVDGERFEVVFSDSSLWTDHDSLYGSAHVFPLFSNDTEEDYEDCRSYVEQQAHYIYDNQVALEVVTDSGSTTTMYKIQSSPAPSVEDVVREILISKNMLTGKFFVHVQANQNGVYVNLDDDYCNVEIMEGATYRIVIRGKENRPKVMPPHSTIMSLEEDDTIYNILLVGETGSGKSTFINSMLTYLNFTSIDSADGQEPVAVIPSFFEVCDVYDQYKTVRVGKSDRNENFNTAGESVTQTPRSYEFSYNHKHYRIIDSPGFGDTRKAEQDKKNLDMILRQVLTVGQIHAICVVLKSSDRLSDPMKFCLSSIRSQLDKEVFKNVFFCFTHANDNHFNAAPSIDHLNKFFHEQEIAYILTTSATFYFDNAGFRYLSTKAQNVAIGRTAEDYRESWDKSRSSATRLLRQVALREPHDLRRFQPVAETRRIVENLIHIAAETVKSIGKNRKKIQEELSLLYSGKKGTSLDEVKQHSIKTTQFRLLDSTKLVCSTPECARTVCQNNILMEGVPLRKLPEPALKNCDVIDEKTGICRQCQCSWTMHYLTKHAKEVITTPTSSKFSEANISITNKQAMKFYEELAKHLEEDERKIEHICARLSTFLAQNSIVTHDDLYLECLKRSRDAAQFDATIKETNSNKTAAQHLAESVSTYEEELELLKRKSGGQISISDVVKYKDELMGLSQGIYRIRESMEAFDEITPSLMKV